jgi:predicted aminopeptidase
VERLGGAQWLAAQGSPQARQAYANYDLRRQQFRALTRATRERLAQIYMENSPLAIENKGLIAMKEEAMSDFRAAYAALRQSWGGYAGYDPWVAQANNAAFGAQAAYDDWVPAFEALFEREGRDWPRFYAAVKQLAQRPGPERVQQLQALIPDTAKTAGQAQASHTFPPL